ncbi:MAG: hypothetical protein ACRDL8_22930, partial [Solirubrobacteraceae bacterium]
MRAVRLALLVGLVGGCRIDLDHTKTTDAAVANDSGMLCQNGTVAACMEAPNHSDLTWIQQNVITPKCTFSGCHNGESTPQGEVDLRAGMAQAHLVGFTSMLEPSRKLVVAGQPTQSYLDVMIGNIQPGQADPPAVPIRSDIGLMPMSAGVMCCQELG